MNKIIFFFLILTSSHVQAYVCKNMQTGEWIDNGSQTIKVPIDSNLNDGENIFANVGDYFSCKNDLPGAYVDIVEIESNGILLGDKLSSQNFSGGIYVNNSRYLAPNSSKINVFSLRDGNWHPIDIDMFFQTPSVLGPYLVIEPGDVLMKVSLFKYSEPRGKDEYFTWTFVAANKAILVTGTCEINNNELIDVDFGEVNKTSISTVGANTRYQINKSLKYDCQDRSVNKTVKISLNATPAAFSNTAFETTTAGLGVEMYHDGKVVAPFSGFNSTLRNGIGEDTVTFTLVKKSNPTPQELKEGDFVANASLIISLP